LGFTLASTGPSGCEMGSIPDSSTSSTASSICGLFGTFENLRKTATKIKANPKHRYGTFTLSMLASVLEPVAEPKIAKVTINGPIVVPKLLIPPAKVNLCEPVCTGPIAIAKGFATVCCNENPNPTINKPDSISGKDSVLAAG